MQQISKQNIKSMDSKIQEMTAQEAMLVVSKMIRLRYLASVMGGKTHSNEILLTSGKCGVIRNGKPYEFSSDMIVKIADAIRATGTLLINTRILATPQSEEEYPLCYGEDYASKFKVMRQAVVLSHIFITMMGKTVRWQKMRLNDKSEVKYYNKFTDEELDTINSCIHSIALTLLSIKIVQ